MMRTIQQQKHRSNNLTFNVYLQNRCLARCNLQIIFFLCCLLAQFDWLACVLAFLPKCTTTRRSSKLKTNDHKSLVSRGLFINKKKKPHVGSASLDSDTVETSHDGIVSVTNSPPSQSLVRRVYETFRWTHNECDYNINYRVEGPPNGPPVLLVHGFGANVNHFRFQFPVLVREGYRVFAVDLLGFGASDKPKDAGYSIELFVQLLTDFIRAMHDQEPWIIAGNSIGGLCCLGVAEQLPSYIQGVVLFNCAGGMTGFRYQDIPWTVVPLLWVVQNVLLNRDLPLAGRFFRNFKTRANVESILRQSGVYRNQTNVNDELLEILLVPGDDAGAEDVFLEVFGGPPGPTPESILPSIRCPILTLWGAADPWTPVDAGAHPGTKFDSYCQGNFTLEVLPGTGHCPHDECPDLVHAKMIPWMRNTRKEFVPPPPVTEGVAVQIEMNTPT